MNLIDPRLKTWRWWAAFGAAAAALLILVLASMAFDQPHLLWLNLVIVPAIGLAFRRIGWA